MPDRVTFEMDTAPLMAALARLGDRALAFTKPASKITADAVQREARSRVARATGQTADNILVSESTDGQGYIVHTSDVRLDRTPIPGSTKERSEFYQEKHVGLWLEKGIHQGKPGSHTAAARPFFYPSVELEARPHERRIADAIIAASEAAGFETRGLGDV